MLSIRRRHCTTGPLNRIASNCTAEQRISRSILRSFYCAKRRTNYQPILPQATEYTSPTGRQADKANFPENAPRAASEDSQV